MSLQKVQGATNSWETGELGSVPPLEDLGMDRVTCIRLSLLGLFNHGFDLPSNCGHDTGWENGVWTGRSLPGDIMVREHQVSHSWNQDGR